MTVALRTCGVYLSLRALSDTGYLCGGGGESVLLFVCVVEYGSMCAGDVTLLQPICILLCIGWEAGILLVMFGMYDGGRLAQVNLASFNHYYYALIQNCVSSAAAFEKVT